VKAFTWSFSKIKNNDDCPRRHFELDLRKPKIFVEKESEQLVWGNKVHSALETALLSKTPLPVEMKPYQHWVDRVAAGAGELLVEQKFALTRDFQPCEYFGPRVWYRGRCDALRINGDIAIAIDWKTGKVKHDARQLMLMAACIFAYHPEVQHILTRFVWLQDDCQTDETYTRADIAKEWVHLLPRVAEYEAQVAANSFPPKPNYLCRAYCPVSSCEFYQKITNRR
jgi:hypothetical protein